MIKKHQYCFANISTTKTRIFMKFYAVTNYYLAGLSSKCHEDLCTNVRTQVINARNCDKTCTRTFTTRVREFMQDLYEILNYLSNNILKHKDLSQNKDSQRKNCSFQLSVIRLILNRRRCFRSPIQPFTEQGLLKASNYYSPVNI